MLRLTGLSWLSDTDRSSWPFCSCDLSVSSEAAAGSGGSGVDEVLCRLRLEFGIRDRLWELLGSDNVEVISIKAIKRRQ